MRVPANGKTIRQHCSRNTVSSFAEFWWGYFREGLLLGELLIGILRSPHRQCQTAQILRFYFILMGRLKRWTTRKRFGWQTSPKGEIPSLRILCRNCFFFSVEPGSSLSHRRTRTGVNSVDYHDKPRPLVP